MNDLFGYLWKDGEIRTFYTTEVDELRKDRTPIFGAYLWTVPRGYQGLITESGFQRLAVNEMPKEFRMHLLLLGVG